MYNILLVDDEPRTIDAIEKNVNWRECGIRKVFRAESMQSAITLYEQEKIDIMICDIEMPNGSGLSLLEWFEDHDKPINCIFVTCHPEFDYMRKAIQLRCYDYILKPINYDEFSQALSELVKRMEATENGATSPDAINWGGLTDGDIREIDRTERDRNVEMEIKKYIHENMTNEISVTNIAETLHFNPQYLMRAFKKKTGMSIVEYITKCRIDTAKKVLRETELPVKKIADMVGYSDYTYFNRVFKKETGMSPKQYRGIQR
ncbi:MAG: AraC family transcriptional regulator [Lachnospiraceae bacterium]|nr:AraC family transcriptional regulator [Lachnospiraceae bacterium]